MEIPSLRIGRLPSLALCAVFSFCAQQTVAQEVGDHQYTSEAVETGSRVYTQQCALCHGPQGDLVDGIDLSIGQFRNAQSDSDLVGVISGGAAEGRMPAFNLRAEEMNGIIAFIRAGFDPEGVAVRIGDPARGKALFEGKGGVCRLSPGERCGATHSARPKQYRCDSHAGVAAAQPAGPSNCIITYKPSCSTGDAQRRDNRWQTPERRHLYRSDYRLAGAAAVFKEVRFGFLRDQ